MREHVDVVIIDNTNEHYCDSLEDFDSKEENTHHEGDNEDEKKSKHHHHCVDMSITNIFTPSVFQFQFVFSPEFKKTTFSYKSLQSSGFLDRLFQPPRA